MRPLRPFEVFCYGVGHFLNDMTAGLWFSFLLIFLTQVAGLDSSKAGTVMLAGQIADALATPVVGWASDHTYFRWGRRKLWVFIGAVIVNLSFFFVFNKCWLCDQFGINETAWYAALASLFNVGWAALQVSHMALVPDLTSDEHERTKLNSARYAGCIAATLAVLLVTTVCFQFLDLTYEAFSITSICAMALGDIMTVFFLFGVPEPPAVKRRAPMSGRASSRNSSGTYGVKQHGWHAWFRVPAFYQVMLVYMLSRISVNLSQVYLPFYLRKSLHLVAHPAVLSEIPAVINIVSFATTLAMRPFNAIVGRMACYAYGTVLVCFGCGVLFWVQDTWWWSTFIFAVVIGLGQTTLLVTAVSMEADLVDKQVSTGAFVYGFMSFADKIGNGILIKFMAQFTEDDNDLRYLNALLPTLSAALGLLFVCTMPVYWRQLFEKLGLSSMRSKPSQIADYTPGINGSVHNINAGEYVRAMTEADEDEKIAEEEQRLINAEVDERTALLDNERIALAATTVEDPEDAEPVMPSYGTPILP